MDDKSYVFKDPKLKICGVVSWIPITEIVNGRKKSDYLPTYPCKNSTFKRGSYTNYSHFCAEHAKEYDQVIENGICCKCGDKVIYPGAPKGSECTYCSSSYMPGII